MKRLTRSELMEILEYDVNSGNFYYLKSTARCIKIGEIAGSIKKDGYIRIVIKKKEYSAHRLVFLFLNGEYPIENVDHINHDRADNRLNNLRLATYGDNNRNSGMRSTNTSGVNGVSWNVSAKRWVSYINGDNKTIHLGSFTSFCDAVDARKNAEILYGYHDNHGKELI